MATKEAVKLVPAQGLRRQAAYPARLRHQHHAVRVARMRGETSSALPLTGAFLLAGSGIITLLALL